MKGGIGMQIHISAVILAKNEEKNIEDCLKSLKWCDEVIIVDDNSIDKTVNIAQGMGAKIYLRSLDNFSNQRNFGLTKVNGEWVLFVDADERISEALAFEISNWTNGVENQYSGFYIPRVDILWGKKLKYGDSNIKLLRLSRKGEGRWKGIVHEEWKINGNVGTLRNSIVHYPHQTVAEFLKEINFYTTLRAKELYSKKTKTNILSIFFYPSGKFILNYFLKKGLLDGTSGLIHALLMSFHSFLVRGKLWVMWNSR